MAAFADALIAELSLAFELVLGGSVVAKSGPPAQGDGWALTFTAAGDLVGTITVWMDRAGSVLLAQRVTSTDDAPGDAVVADMLKEMWSQATRAVSAKAPFTGVRLTLDGPALAAAGDRQLTTYTVAFAADGSAQVTVSGAVRVAEIVAAAAPPVRASEVQTRQLQPPPAAANLDVVLDIDLPLIVRFGRTLMTLKTLAALGPGSILDMGRSPDEPVEILVGEQVIARGEVVIAGGNYGVRITDLVSPSDRIKALEG
jgi:flagellar motor switch protein FliN